MVFSKSNFNFSTPENLYHDLQPVAAISVPHPISWADEERDLTAWLGNELQDEAFAKLYSYEPKIRNCSNPGILKDWQYLQTSNHFYYMCTKWFSAGEVHKYFNPYGSPYEAFINYMNVLSDFMIRVDDSTTAGIDEKTEVPAPGLIDEKAGKAVKKAVKAKIKPEKISKKATKTEVNSGKAIKKTSGQKTQPEKIIGSSTTQVNPKAEKKVKKKTK